MPGGRLAVPALLVASLLARAAAGGGHEGPLAELTPEALRRLAPSELQARLQPESPLGGRALRVVASPPGRGIALPGSWPWARARFLAFDAWSDADHAGEVLLRFFAGDEGEPRLSVSLGLLPRLATRLSLPLRVLDAQAVFLPRTPGRLKGVVSGRRLAPAEIARVELQLKRTAAPQALLLGAVRLLEQEPSYPAATAPLVDGLGQWNDKQWPGKTRDETELRRDLTAAAADARAARFPAGWCALGGSLVTTFAATGYFRIQHDGRRYWLVDPEGHGFFSLGLDSVGPGEAAALVPGTEPLFGPLPPREGAFAAAWGEPAGAERLATYSFAVANLIRGFGPEWRQRWAELTRGRLVAWRFNTVANWSDAEFRRAEGGLPYVIPLAAYPATAVSLFRDFPDVFAEEFRASSRRFAEQLAPYRGEARLIGYFMRNEPLWAFGANNVAAEMLESAPGSASRRVLARWLRERYDGDERRWTRAWGLGLSAFGDVERSLVPRAAERSAAARADLWDFSKELVRAYVGIPAEECRRVDPDHLNLGLRYAWISSELVFEAASAFDVFTLNAYDALPPAAEIASVARRTGKPVLIGEFHFGALDRGLPATGLRGVASQRERGVAYRRYVEAAAADPNVVGAHYFVLNDQHLLGRFDGENFQIGFVDVCHRPYGELVEAARRTHEAVYALRREKIPAFGEQAREIPRVGF